ncbi:hypothetical protein [Streptomyces sp. CA-111067]|uniref:hypothetical protein n=1 Tax=Streptomyces sp. CA-111067 TaxID=3240046 RepID=UPI003D954E85
MRSTCVYSGLIALALGAAGCSVGQGAPDGWRYLRTGPVAVAHPKTWQRTPTGAELRRPGGATAAQLTVVTASAAPAAPAESAAPRAGHGAPPPPPPAARTETLRIAGRPARVRSYLAPAPDGRPATWVNVTLSTPAGRPVEVTAWTLATRPSHASAGEADGPLLLREIVDSIELP